MPSAAFCPHAPLLVDGVTGGRVPQVEELRAACREAGAAVAGADRVTLVGTANIPELQRFPVSARGTLAGLGVDAPTGGGTALPLSLTVGRWLLDGAGASLAGIVAVPPDLPAADCLRLGESLADDDLLVLADGSNRRGEKPPGGPHPGADGFDAAVAAALAAGDVEALARLDGSLADEVGSTGRAAWQVLAGWARGRGVTARVTYDGAPFGVGYLVGVWSVPAG